MGSCKLTPDDKQLLQSWHFSERDIAQISEAICQTTYTAYTAGSTRGRRISADTAIETLGREAFLSGIGRSAFHYSALRENDEHTQVIFDSNKLFQ